MQVNPQLTAFPDLDALIMKMLVKAPDDRPTIKEVLVRLDQIAPPPRVIEASAAPGPKIPGWKIAALVLGTVALFEAAAGGIYWFGLRDRALGTETSGAVPSPVPTVLSTQIIIEPTEALPVATDELAGSGPLPAPESVGLAPLAGATPELEEPTLVPTRTPAQLSLRRSQRPRPPRHHEDLPMTTLSIKTGQWLKPGVKSDIGKRPNQEDRSEIKAFETADGRPALLALVADGIGGHNTGEIASQRAIERVPARLLDPLPSASEIAPRLKQALEEASRAIYDESLANPNRADMGTTCTAIVLLDRRLCLAHVGDTRLYLFRAGELRQLSIDHTAR